MDTPESGNTVLQALISTPSLISVPRELKHIITGYVTVAKLSIFTQVPRGIAITEGTGAWEHDPCGIVPAPKKKSWW